MARRSSRSRGNNSSSSRNRIRRRAVVRRKRRGRSEGVAVMVVEGAGGLGEREGLVETLYKLPSIFMFKHIGTVFHH